MILELKKNRPNMKDVADEAGVSKSAVSLALRNDSRISEKTRLMVHAAAEKLGYQRNPVVDSLMTQLRVGSSPTFQANIGLINCTESDNLSNDRTVSHLRDGVCKRAKQLGYGIEEFWLQRSDATPERLEQILHARGIRGLILIVPLSEKSIDQRFLKVWSGFPCAILGSTLLADRFNCATNDQYLTTRRSAEKLIGMGYQRPMLIVPEVDDVLHDNKFSAGFVSVTSRLLPLPNRIDPVWYLEGDSSENLTAIEKYKPDVIISNKFEIYKMVLKAGISVPEDIGFYLMDWQEDNAGISGMRQNNRSVGAACADLVVEHIQKNEGGIQLSPKVVLIESKAVEGHTVVCQ
ncbi:MAG: LacI family DNA-binding transcriptional regulator [Verrucomicrobiota bacterium]